MQKLRGTFVSVHSKFGGPVPGIDAHGRRTVCTIPLMQPYVGTGAYWRLKTCLHL